MSHFQAAHGAFVALLVLVVQHVRLALQEVIVERLVTIQARENSKGRLWHAPYERVVFLLPPVAVQGVVLLKDLVAFLTFRLLVDHEVLQVGDGTDGVVAVVGVAAVCVLEVYAAHEDVLKEVVAGGAHDG